MPPSDCAVEVALQQTQVWIALNGLIKPAMPRHFTENTS
jgi:hypothetical protein